MKLQGTLAGAPDRILLLPGGRVWFVEFKAAGGRVSPRQVNVARRLNALGFLVTVCWDRAGFVAMLNRLVPYVSRETSGRKNKLK